MSEVIWQDQLRLSAHWQESSYEYRAVDVTKRQTEASTVYNQ